MLHADRRYSTPETPMRQPAGYVAEPWDSPLWQLTRMLVDVSRHRAYEADEIPQLLASKRGNPSSLALAEYLRRHPQWLEPLAAHLAFRLEAEEQLLSLMRTQEAAIADLQAIERTELQRYGTRSDDHHQSPKVVVQTVSALTRLTCGDLKVEVNLDPQGRTTSIGANHVWVSPRRLDGALPSLVNPVGIWEIKEYWGKTGGGSKMSDAIYEIQLVGTEIRAFQRLHPGVDVKHYAILDGQTQWLSRRSDLRRAVDLLCMGLVDELIVGSEILTEWPRIVEELCGTASERSSSEGPDS